MKYLHLIWSALARSRMRTVLTLLSVVTAFLLFGMLDSVRVAFNNSGQSLTGADRLVVASKLSITQSLPYRLLPQIEAVPGVEDVAFGNWFGGVYRDMQNFFPNFAVSDDYFRMYPEFAIAPEQLEAFRADRTGAVVGGALAEKFDWTIGDTIPLQATIFPRDGSNDWQFTLRGIFHVEDEAMKQQENQLMFHWEYFNEANDYISDEIGWMMVRVADPSQADRVGRAIDAISANSDHETKTQTEAAWTQSFMKQFADVGLIVTAIMGAVFFTLLLLTGNTMAQAVRERIPELAVLKTIGFTDRTVLMLVLAESVLLIGLGGLLGMALAQALVAWMAGYSQGLLPGKAIPTETWLVALALVVGLGLVVGLLPALRAKRLKIVDALAGR
ncbi:ABC transporter permease [Lysobacter sp. GX 14042]|uniref:ABC transporter permease n=1 Tax=Lysobacter sp. GX 14042 TaxID=2907155 RepID=UPI001F481F0F|nr:ABC transporter permease [Lysobacter sp. GX 14042]MCE7032046.1 ABC transporter permease [Lysobacter sp. GX 14042]